MAEPTVSIVILNFNGLKDTIACLNSVLKTTYKRFKVYVVDNGSDNNETVAMKKVIKSRKCTYIRFSKNYGFTGGNNRVMRNLKSKYIILLNNDTLVRKNWLSLLIKTAESDARIAVVQPKIIWEKNRDYFDYAGAAGGFIDLFGYPFTRGRIFNYLEADRRQYDGEMDIFWASGAAMLIRRQALSEVGYLNEEFFNYMEEIDLCYRIHTRGYRIVCDPKSVIFHKVASTSSKMHSKKRYWEHRNNLLFILFNYPHKDLLLLFPARIVMDYLSLFYYLLNGRFSYCIALLAAHWYVLNHFRSAIRKKRRHFSLTNSTHGVYLGSVVLSHFLFGRKKFSDLFYRNSYLQKIQT